MKTALKKSDPADYVYTLAAVRSRLKRWWDVWLFLPYYGCTIRVTKDNYKRSAERFRQAEREDNV